MTQEMKLLHALCEALGFEVETTLDYQERKITKERHSFEVANLGKPYIDAGRVTASDSTGRYIADEDGMYTSLLISPIVDYKLTVKAEDIAPERG